MEFRTFIEEDIPHGTAEFHALMQALKEKYPGVELFAWEHDNKIYFSEIRVPKEQRNQGIGSEIMRVVQKYAQSVGKPIVLSPESSRGKKGALERFYKNLDFVHNRGRHKDYSLSNFGGPTMLWRPSKGDER
jgi:GNAT superfamily N-acetyltransferase